MGRAGGNAFGGSRIDVHDETVALLKKLTAAGVSRYQIRSRLTVLFGRPRSRTNDPSNTLEFG